MKKPVPFGKYFLLERINVGGMAEVFRAKSFGVEGFERLVAVKRILPNIAEDRDFIKMFIDEAKIAVQLNHANIAQIFDLGCVDGAYYIALEHIHGRDVRAIFDRCRQQGEPMSIAQACFIVMKLCEGLDYAHNKRDQNNREIGLVHRDVSPQNVLVSHEGEVKVIDFGIAKAADKSAKTQAGILKGKFGYMSPEQVRGLPIDRRSDIFSCGIVLYELLTGERLFVGESDFSTLEKVRNVEILPPSTYNRKVPDELERIVLKALAKDTDERYQNAIDLHDELQAFVYTASEFYSRKDLAAWMKRTWAKEIEEESAKLESYRQLKPPPEMVSASRASTSSEQPIVRPGPSTTRPPMPQTARRPTSAMAVVPPPIAGQGGPPTPKPPPPPAMGRSTMNMPAMPVPAAMQARTATPSAGMQLPHAPPPGHDDDGLSWDDDELETQIYDNPEEEAAARAAKGTRKPANGGGAGHGAGLAATMAATASEPDLSSLVSTAKGWEAPPAIGAPAPIRTGPNTPTLLGTSNGNGHGHLAAGSNQTPSPFGAVDHDEPAFAATSLSASSPNAPVWGRHDARESSAVVRLVEQSEPIFDSMAELHAIQRPPRQGMKTSTIVAIAAVVLFVGGIAAVWIATRGGSETNTAAREGTGADGSGGTGGSGGSSGSADTVKVGVGTGTSGSTQPEGSGATPGTGTSDTPLTGAAGFDLYVTPANVVAWRLDGVAKTSTLPARINGLSPGRHTVAIDAPAGFMSEARDVDLVDGEMQKVEIKLTAIEIIGLFSSEPAGAKVTLVTGGQRIDLGPTPATFKLDPAQKYEVVFEKDGYVSVSKPVQISGQPEEKIAALLEPARVTQKDPDSSHRPKDPVIKKDPTPKDPTPKDPTPKDPTPKDPTPKDPTPKDPTPKGEGVLSLGAKPPCDIYVDGKSTGLKTPQRELKLSAGRHKITLMNNEYGIKESFTVEIKAGEVTKQVKDFSDRMAAPE